MTHEEEPYCSVATEQLILRDHLAADRTVLANERTFLAYVRTALALVVSGLTLIHFFKDATTTVIGWILMPLGAVTLVVGIRDYWRMKRRIAFLNRDLPAPPPPDEKE